MKKTTSLDTGTPTKAVESPTFAKHERKNSINPEAALLQGWLYRQTLSNHLVNRSADFTVLTHIVSPGWHI